MNDQMISNMLHLQDTMNSKVNPDWRTAGYAWLRAVVVEGGEALEHWGWKWWKKQTPDMAQFRIELVDIWHFILSATILIKDEDPLQVIGNALEDDEAEVMVRGQWVEFDKLDALTRIETLTGLAALRYPIDDIIKLFDYILINDAKMTYEDLYKGYMAKNVLNFFRQDHGYKTGEYVKDWSGEEDNVWLERIAETLAPDADFQVKLYAELTKVYTTVLDAKALQLEAEADAADVEEGMAGRGAPA